MSWFILDRETMTMEYPKTPDKFNEIAKKEIISGEDFDWLCKNDLVDRMIMAKGGGFVFKANVVPENWKAILGSID